MAEENKTTEEVDLPLTVGKVHPLLKEKLEARQAINRGDVLPNDPIFEERVNFPNGPGGYMALSDSSVLNNGVTPVVRLYTIVKSVQRLTEDEFLALRDLIKTELGNPSSDLLDAELRSRIESETQDTVRKVIYQIGDHTEPSNANVYEPISNVSTGAAEVVNLSNAQGYDPTLNHFFKPGVGITRVNIKSEQALANFGNTTRVTVELLCENIHDFFEFVEPNFCGIGAMFNVDVAWSNVELYDIEELVLQNKGMRDIIDHLYTFGPEGLTYIDGNRGDIISLSCRLLTYKTTVTKTGGMRVVIDAIAGDAKSVVDQPIRETATSPAIDLNLENTIWETIQQKIAGDYETKLVEEASYTPVTDETGAAAVTEIRDEFGNLTKTVSFRVLTASDLVTEVFDEEGNLIPTDEPVYESIIDPQTGEEIYYDPVTGENFIAILMNETTVEKAFFNQMVLAKAESGYSWDNFIGVALPYAKTAGLLPSFDGQAAQDEFYNSAAGLQFLEDLIGRFTPEYEIINPASIIRGGEVKSATNVPTAPYEWMSATNTIAEKAWFAAVLEFNELQLYNANLGPSAEDRAAYAMAPPPPMTNTYLSRRTRQVPLIVNAENEDPNNRLNLLADFLKQQSGLYMDSITTPNAVASEWGVWLRRLSDDIRIPGRMLDSIVETNNLSVNDFYVQLGWFEDEILNRYYGLPEYKEVRSFKSRLFNSSDSLLRRFKEYEILMSDRIKNGDAPYLVYPNSYQMSYNAEQKTVPASYRAENVTDSSRIDSITGIAVNYEFHTKKNGFVPMREVFINVGKMIESFRDTKVSLNDALIKMMDDISKDSEGFYSLELAAANSHCSYNQFIELNHRPVVRRPLSDRLEEDPDIFYFRPFSPDSIVHDVKMGVKYTSDLAKFQFAGILEEQAREAGLISKEVDEGKVVGDMMKLVDYFTTEESKNKGRGESYYISDQTLSKKATQEKITNQKRSAMITKGASTLNAVKQIFNQALKTSGPAIVEGAKVTATDAAVAKDLVEDTLDKPIGATKTVDVKPPTERPLSRSARYLRNLKVKDSMTPVLLQYEIELGIWGTGLFKFQDMISLDYLPRRIKRDHYFILNGISHTIDNKAWKTDLTAVMVNRADKKEPVEEIVKKAEEVDTPVYVPKAKQDPEPPEPDPKDSKQGEDDKNKENFQFLDPIDFGKTVKRLPEIEKLDGVSRADTGTHQGKSFNLFFQDLILWRGKLITGDFDWILRGAAAYAYEISPSNPSGPGVHYFPGNINAIQVLLDNYGYNPGRTLHQDFSMKLWNYFTSGQGEQDPLKDWYSANYQNVNVFGDKKLQVKKGKKYIRLELENFGNVILGVPPGPEPFYDYVLPTPETPADWDQETYGPWRDDQLKRLFFANPNLTELYSTWYDSARTEKPAPGTPSADKTGYQVLRYEFSAQQRRNDWFQYVAKPGKSAVNAVADLISNLNRWETAWTRSSTNRAIDIRREKTFAEARRQ